jgi:DNA-binding transcriptional ArsR family regulator
MAVTPPPSAVAVSPPAFDELALLARWVRGLGNPVRLAILKELRSGERGVEQLCDALEMSQPRISNHLACLRACRFVSTRRDGNRIFYSLADHNVGLVIDLAGASVAENADGLLACSQLSEEI